MTLKPTLVSNKYQYKTPYSCALIHVNTSKIIILTENVYLTLQIPMAIMQFFTKRFQKKKDLDQHVGLEKLTCDCESKVDVLKAPHMRGSRKLSETLSTIYTEDNIFQSQFR